MSSEAIARTEKRSDVALLGATGALVYLLCTISGVSGLIYEVIWTRKLSLVFGVTSYAMTTVLTSFLAGLALGAYVFGRYIERSRRPMLIYGLMELGIGISATLMFLAIGVLESIYASLYHGAGGASGQLTALRFIVAFLLVLVPTMLMGGTLPVLCRSLVQSLSTVGMSTGLLYALNTLGGTVGCFCAGYVLIGRLGLWGTNLIAATINISIGVIALVIAASAPRRAPAEPAQPEEPPAEVPAGQAYPNYVFPLVLVAFGLSGFAALAYEIIWTRVLMHYMQSMTYSFSLMLTVYLLGLVIGSYLLARFADRLRNLLWAFGVIELCIAASVYVSIHLMMGLRDKFAVIVMPDFAAPWLNWFIAMSASAVPAMLIPTTLLGMIFPIISRFYTRNLRAVGRSIGTVYAANTLGSILGAFLAGFWIVPWLGMSNSLRLMIIINLLVGMVMIVIATARAQQVGRLTAAAVVTLVLLAVSLSGGDFVRKGIDERLKAKMQDLASAPTSEMIYFGEGVDGTVSIYTAEARQPSLRSSSTASYMFVNGTMLTGSPFFAERYMRLSGHLPALLAKAPKRGLVICVGTGITASALAHHDYLEAVDAVELSDEVLRAAEAFTTQDTDPTLPRNDTLYNPRVNIVRGDGRNYMLLTDKQYDIITLEPPPPREAGVVNLYSRDFYELCKQHLTDGGIMYQWFPFHSQTEQELKWLYMTFLDVFPDAQLWVTVVNESFLVGSNGPIELNYNRLQERIQNPAIQSELAAIGIFDADAFLSCYFASGDAVWQYANGPAVNLDIPEIERVLATSEAAALKQVGITDAASLVSMLFSNQGPQQDAKRATLRLAEARKQIQIPAIRQVLQAMGIDGFGNLCAEYFGVQPPPDATEMPIDLDELAKRVTLDIMIAETKPDATEKGDIAVQAEAARRRGRMLKDLKIADAAGFLAQFFGAAAEISSGAPGGRQAIIHLPPIRKRVEVRLIRESLQDAGIYGFDQLCRDLLGTQPAAGQTELTVNLDDLTRRIKLDLALAETKPDPSEKSQAAFEARLGRRRGHMMKALNINSALDFLAQFCTPSTRAGRGPIGLSMRPLRTKLNATDNSAKPLRQALQAIGVTSVKSFFAKFAVETCPIITDDRPIIEFFPITDYDWSEIRREALANLLDHRVNVIDKVVFGPIPQESAAARKSLGDYCKAMEHLYRGQVAGAKGDRSTQRSEWQQAYSIDTRNPYFAKLILAKPTAQRTPPASSPAPQPPQRQIVPAPK